MVSIYDLYKMVNLLGVYLIIWIQELNWIHFTFNLEIKMIIYRGIYSNYKCN